LKDSKQQIRLLRIRSGEAKDPIVTSMFVVDLANSPRYEALSYVWMTARIDTSILVDGSVFPVGQGLLDALQAVRRSDSDRVIWADAICINQEDIVEKTHQIPLMGLIYRAAVSVIAYLGKPTERTEMAMRVLSHFVCKSDETEQSPWAYERYIGVEESLLDIMTRSWFTRIWTVQEVTLAKHTSFVCGPHELSWHCDSRSLKSILFRIKSAAISPYFTYKPGGSSQIDWSPMIDILETQLRQAAKRERIAVSRNHLDLAYDFRHRKSTLAVDKYFAIFGIIENDRGGEFRLDVAYDIPLEVLHQRFTREIQRLSDMADAQFE
jgi:hypothetical protein